MFNKFGKILAKIVRIVTLPPLAALATLSVFLYCKKIVLSEYIVGALCLTVLPMLSYVVEPLFRTEKVSKRDNQRKIAVWFSAVGYALCNISAWVMNSGGLLKTFYLTYLMSVLTILLVGKLFHVKCSGHACGFVGPLVFLGCFIDPLYFWGLFLLAGLVWASVHIKRHTVSELAIGSFIPIVSMAVAYLMLINGAVFSFGQQIVTVLAMLG